MTSQYLSEGMLIVEHIKKAIAECQEIDKEYHCFTYICEKEALARAEEIQKKIDAGKQGKLAGLLVTVKENICMKDVESNAGSAILKGYRPVFNATAVQLLEDEDAIMIARTTMDEFGFGSWNTAPGIGFPVPLNPHDTSRVTGGSSGGAAAITSLATFPHVALSESTGGSIECPAAFCGVVGFCPSYGSVSRSGLIPYANSLDKIGLMAKTAEEIPPVMEIISQKDSADATSTGTDELQTPKAKLKIGMITEALERATPEAAKSLKTLREQLEKEGHTVVDATLPLTFKYGVACYYVISTSEASTNLATLCGLRYGVQEDPKGKSMREYFTSIRTKSFGTEAKRRIILGTFARMHGYRDAYYIQATKVRTLILEEYAKQLGDCDLLLSPTMPSTAPSFSEAKEMTPLEVYNSDVLTVGPNLAGLPHVTIPAGSIEGMPFGIMATSKRKDEQVLFDFAKTIGGLQ